MAREQCVIVGVMRTVSTVRGEVGVRGLREMSGRLTTEREPRVRGCSGSEMGAMRSVGREEGGAGLVRVGVGCVVGGGERWRTVDFLLVDGLDAVGVGV